VPVAARNVAQIPEHLAERPRHPAENSLWRQLRLRRPIQRDRGEQQSCDYDGERAHGRPPGAIVTCTVKKLCVLHNRQVRPKVPSDGFSAGDQLALASSAWAFDWRISSILRSTCLENTYSAGRWRSSGISGVMSPSVRGPRRLTVSAFSGWATASLTADAS